MNYEIIINLAQDLFLCHQQIHLIFVINLFFVDNFESEEVIGFHILGQGYVSIRTFT